MATDTPLVAFWMLCVEKENFAESMKVLFLSDHLDGGIRSHVRCLQRCLSELGVANYAIGEDEPFAGRSGHDLRELFQLRRTFRRFRPDVIHFHVVTFWGVIYVNWLRLLAALKIGRCPAVVQSIHIPYDRPMSKKTQFNHSHIQPCYCLPVSEATWGWYKLRMPCVQGQVFFNPIFIKAHEPIKSRETQFRVGAVGRNAPQKDWPSCCAVIEAAVRLLAKAESDEHLVFWGVGVEGRAAFDFGDGAKLVEWMGPQSNGREWIAKMDLFVLTSSHEEMPTVVLECFVERTPICGFIPKGGMKEILAFSNGALREVFIEERSVDKLAAIVVRLVRDPDLRHRVVEDGWQIVTNHFDAMKNCRDQLIPIYERLITEEWP